MNNRLIVPKEFIEFLNGIGPSLFLLYEKELKNAYKEGYLQHHTLEESIKIIQQCLNEKRYVAVIYNSFSWKNCKYLDWSNIYNTAIEYHP